MKVNRKPFVLKKEGRDVLGGTFPAGAEAVEGICYFCFALVILSLVCCIRAITTIIFSIFAFLNCHNQG
jgi:hypothetical protein